MCSPRRSQICAASPNSNIADEIIMQANLSQFQRQQIALITRITPYAMAGHLLNTNVLAIAVAGSVPLAELIVWCIYSYLIASLLLYRHLQNRGHSARSFRRAAQKAAIYAFFLALPWSSMAVLHLGALSQDQELIVIALGVGMAASGTILLAAAPSAAFVYMSVILLPSALKCVFLNQKGYFLLGALALSCWGFLAALIAKITRDIRERKKAELILAERNAQLALAGKAALVGSYAYDTDANGDANTVMQVSEGYIAIHGLCEGTVEIARSEWRTGVHPEDIVRLDVLRSQAFRDQQGEYNVDYRIVRSGEVRWIESRSFISYDREGHPQRVVGVNIDVTDRKRTEALLKESKVRLADALSAGQVMAFEWDAVTGRSQHSENAADILGSAQSEGASSPRSDFLSHVHPDERTNLKTHIRQLRPGDSSYAVSFRYVRPDGRQIWLEECAKGEFDATGKLLRIKGLTRDITARKQTEVALRASEAKFAGILAIAGDAIISIDAKHRITLFNEAAERLFGYSQNEILGQPVDLLIPAIYRAAHEQNIERSASSPGIARRMADRQEVAGRRKSGEEFPAEVSISKLKIGGEWVYTSVVRDITERKRAEERQRVLVAELDHRVKNVLASVTAVVAHTRQESSSVTNFAAALDGRIRSMAMTHDLLSARRWQGISLTELVRRELAPYAARNNTEINGPEAVLCPEAGQAMAMVLHELATNAAKYGALSTSNGRVSIRWHRRMNGQPWQSLVLEWQEIGGPPVVATSNPSYGTSTIRDLIPYEFGGTVDHVLARDGVRFHLQLPGNWFSTDSEPVSRAITHANDS
jgi:PAS domain S-box-containing protein